MKKLLFTLSMIIIGLTASFAQVPQGFNYQAVARDNSGVAIVSQNIGLQISLRQGSSNGTIVYTETHTIMSSNIGLLNLVVGAGTSSLGVFSGIDWATGPYFVEISMDVAGGTNYVLMGTQQLMSVPYALYAANSGAGVIGYTGATGLAGATGVFGVTGATGENGLMGNTGSIGNIGVTGATGVSGDMGLVGVTGNTGNQGGVGVTGATGASGLDGDKYATSTSTLLSNVTVSTPLSFVVASGLAYSIGQEVIIAYSTNERMTATITNYNSTTGVMDVTVLSSIGSVINVQPWLVNLNGAPGPAGDVGATGVIGTTGLVGYTGVTGATGDMGLIGATGAGYTGATGLVGATGEAGVTGATGAGYTGATGSDGNVGVTGTTGAVGLVGATGLTGATGAVGATGADATFAVQFNVVNSGASAYLFDNPSDYVSGANSNPTIILYRGFTYKFNISASGHPFRIASTQGGSAFNVGVSSNDISNGTITFKVPQNAPSQLFYYCIFHPGMAGTINIM